MRLVAMIVVEDFFVIRDLHNREGNINSDTAKDRVTPEGVDLSQNI